MIAKIKLIKSNTVNYTPEKLMNFNQLSNYRMLRSRSYPNLTKSWFAQLYRADNISIQ